MSASRTIKLRSRVVETTDAIPGLGPITPIDNGSDQEGSERATGPTPGDVESRRPDDVSSPRHPSLNFDNEMEDQESPTRGFGYGRDGSGLVSEPELSTGIFDKNTADNKTRDGNKRRLSWSARESPPHLSGRGRGVRFSSIREPAKLSREQLATVATAEATLTPNEQLHIAQRQESEATSHGEGPSRNKGKGKDPLEFGGINYESGEEDPEIQIAMYEAYKEAANRKLLEVKKRAQMAKIRNEHTVSSSVPPETKGNRIPTLSGPIRQSADRGSVPTDQRRTPFDRIGVMPSGVLHPKSTIARTLQYGGRPTANHEDDGDDYYNSSSSSSSSSDSSDSYSEFNRVKRRKNKKKSKRKIMVRPKEPTEYSGEIDFRKFNRFLKEARMYLKDARFPKKEYIMRIALFLKGKALNFYTQRGEMYETQWSLKTFFNQLFDYCFPPNYRMNLREKLENANQHSDHLVSQYAHHIQELFGMLGNVAVEDQVVKLWKGLKPKIQEGLWRDKLNPDHSTWDEVLEQAVRIEMAIKAVKSIGQKKNPNTKQPEKNEKSQSSRPFKGNKFQVGNQSGNPENKGEPNTQGEGSSKKGQTNNSKQNKDRSRFKSANPNAKANQGERNYKHQGKQVNSNNQKPNPDHSGLTCYNCGETGHISRNCPTGNVVSHQGTKPPGAANYSVEISALDPTIESDETEVLDSLPLGAMSLEGTNDEPFWYESIYGKNTPARPALGDCYAMFIEWILSSWKEYPVDERFKQSNTFTETSELKERFLIKRTGRSRKLCYLITDSFIGFRIKVPLTLLEKPMFDLRNWYAKRVAKHYQIRTRSKIPYRSFGYPLQEIPEMLLLDGVNSHYPSVDFYELVDADRFAVELMTPETQSGNMMSEGEGKPSDVISMYLIKDQLLELEIPILRNHLMDPKFDLVGWYREFLDETGIYSKYYKEEVLEVNKGLLHYRSENSIDPIEINKLGGNELPDAESEDSLPGLQELSDSEDESVSEDGSLLTKHEDNFMFEYTKNRMASPNPSYIGPVIEERVWKILEDYVDATPNGLAMNLPILHDISCISYKDYKRSK